MSKFETKVKFSSLGTMLETQSTSLVFQSRPLELLFILAPADRLSRSLCHIKACLHRAAKSNSPKLLPLRASEQTETATCQGLICETHTKM